MPNPTFEQVAAEPDPKDRRAVAARAREARSTQGVTALLARRPELRGVLRTADWLEESVRWTA